jgi:hypothetical protein
LSYVYISIKLQHFGSWIFFRLQVKKGKTKTLPVWPLVELASDQGHFLPEDGKRSSSRNVILLKYRQWTKSKKKHFTDYNAPSSEPFRLQE